MEWLHDKDQIEHRDDGTFVVQALIVGEWMPYHVTQEYSPEMYAEVVDILLSEVTA